MGSCADSAVFVSLAEGRLTDVEVGELEAHLAACVACANIAAELARTCDPGDVDVPWIAPGERVGRYEVKRWLGSGGMGQVFVAQDPQLGRDIALKLVRASQPQASQSRLLGEAQAMAQLTCPNVVSVYDAGVADGRAFIAMEWVRGISLAEWSSASHGPGHIVETMLAAGRGLLAAHQAGILHRDFKPANVLVGDDGRVQVTDFGLAHVVGDALSDRQPLFGRGSPQQTSATVSGASGTPSYMAPEQRDRSVLDERSDQFSFCVTFWELLYKQQPFEDGVGGDRHLQPPPRRHPAADLAPILARGLRDNPDERFPTMADLLVAVEEKRKLPSRRRWLLAASALVVVTGGVAVTTLSSTFAGQPTIAELCGDPAADVEQMWGSRRVATKAAFLAGGGALASSPWAKIESVLDDYSADYVDAYQTACAATYREQRQSTELLDRRLACFADRRFEFSDLVDEYASITSALLDRTVRAAHQLIPVSECDEHAVLGRMVVPPPTEYAGEVAAVRAQLREFRTLRVFGRFDDATALAKRARTAAESTGYKPLIASALLKLSFDAQHRGAHEEALDIATKALHAAEAIGHTDLAARAAIDLATGTMHLRKPPEETDRWLTLAEALSEKLGPRTQLAEEIARARGRFATIQGDHRSALQHRRRALAIATELYPPGSPNIADARVSVAAVQSTLGDNDDAIETLSASLDALVEALGDEHFDSQRAKSNLAKALGRAGNRRLAIKHLRELLATRIRLHGTSAIIVASSQINLAITLADSDPEAVELLLRARQTVLDVDGPSDQRIATIDLNLAAIAVANHHYTEATKRVRNAIALLEALVDENHPRLSTGHAILGDALCGLGKCSEAVPALERALEGQVLRLGSDHPRIVVTKRSLGLAQLKSGARSAGIANLEAAVAMSEKAADASVASAAILSLAEALRRSDPVRARTLAREGHARLEQENPDHAEANAEFVEFRRSIGDIK